MNIEKLYRQDIASIPEWRLVGTEQRDHLIEQARAGDRQARNTLILALLPYVLVYAIRYQRYHIDIMELVGVGNSILVEHFEQALQEANPCGYLVKFAHGEMIQYVRRFQGPITLPTTPGDEPYPIMSLINDTDTFDIEEQHRSATAQDYTPLYEALAHLPTEQSKASWRDCMGCQGKHKRT